MKTFSFIFGLVLISLFSCANDDEIKGDDPIVGNWKLVSKSFDGVNLEFTDCLSQTRAEFYSDNTVSFEIFYDDDETGNCEFSASTQSWTNNNGTYAIFISGSGINQDQSVVLDDSQLIYSFTGIDITDDGVNIVKVEFVYEKL